MRPLYSALLAICCPPTAVALAILYIMAIRAPLGYEDETGYHRGRPT